MKLGSTLCKSLTYLFFTVLLVSTTLFAQTKVEPPDTPVGKVFRAWQESFNSADHDKIFAFQAAHLPKVADPEKRVQNTLNLVKRTGGFDLEKIESSSDLELVAIVKERNSDNRARMELAVSSADHAQIDNIGINLIGNGQPGGPQQAPPRPPAERVSLDALTKDVEAKLADLAAKDKFSGVAMIAKDGKPLWQKAYGYADRAAKKPNTVETIFRLGSMNKMFTSVAIAQLVQKGKLKFTDTLAQVMPDYPNQEIAKKVTVHQLLTHSSGLGDIFTPEFEAKKDSVRKLKDYLPFFAGTPLKFEPGQGWAYSNAGFIVLGLIVEKISGEDYYDYVQHHIYDVAGMKHSGSIPKDQKVDGLATGYMKDGPDAEWSPNWGTLPWRGMSAGGGDSTAVDLLKFDQALRAHKLLNAELTDMVITGKVHPPQFSLNMKYAYGFGDSGAGEDRVVGHNGGAPGMNAQLDIHWTTGYTVVVLSNFDPPSASEWARYISDRLPLK